MEKISFTFTPDEGFYARLAAELAKHLHVPNDNAAASRQSNWLTHTEAAAYLKKTPAALYKLTSLRLIKFHKRGKPNYYRIEDLDAYMAAGEMKTADEIKANAQLAPKRKYLLTTK